MIFVFLVNQYESWSIPFPVLMSLSDAGGGKTGGIRIVQ